MLTFNVSPDELQLFIEETEEQLQLLDQDIVLLEKEGPRPELLQEIFRAAHTLKGSSGAIGHRKMAALTHAMENVFDQLRQGKAECGTELIDVLLQSLDALRLLKEEVLVLEDCGFDPSELVAWLNASAGKEAAPGPDDREADGCPATPNPLVPMLRVTVVIAAESELPAARCFQAYLEASNYGDIVSSQPSLEAIEMEQVDHCLKVVIQLAGDLKELEASLRGLPDVETVETEELAVSPYGESPALASSGTPNGSVRSPEDPQVTVESAPSAEKQPAPARSNGLSKTIRIDVARLDDLMNLVGELVIDRTRLANLGSQLQSRYEDESLGDLAETSRHIGRIVDELQEGIMKARMLPLESLFNRVPRVVRDLAQKSGKKIDFAVEGEETELDRSVIEELHDPLIHLLRNAVDHGIETPEERAGSGKSEVGRVKLSAAHRENRIVIRVEDDGAGIDPNKLRQTAVRRGMLSAEAASHLSDREAMELIFAPGFSTKESVSDVSGRGVGTDIVRTNIEKLNGSATVESIVGKGTCFTLELPLTVAIMDALMVGLGDQVLAIPLVSVVETLRVKKSEIHSINKHQAVQLRDSVLPLVELDDALSMSLARPASDRVFIVAVRVGENRLGLVVDSLLGELQVVIKSLGRQVGSIRGVTGATILGDGRVALILDVPSLIKCVMEEQSRGWAA